MKVVSLFSGAGGLDLGFKMAGHDIIWANDMYADAVETYKKNIGDHIICEDISKIKAEDIPDCDIIIGGFPCQGFSVANTKRHEDDERNVLYKQLIRMIDAKRPKFFLAENVKGITNLAKGKVFQMILKDFTELGYKVKHKILNAADMNDKEIVFSKSIKAGKRIYYLDVKKNRKDEMFLAITESKKVITGEGDDSQVSFEKHKIFLYREDFQKFMAGLEEAVNFIECSDANEYIARLNTEADEESEQKAIEEARENKLENEIKIDIDF